MPNISKKQVEDLTNEEIKKLLEDHMSYHLKKVFHETVQSRIREIALQSFDDTNTSFLSYDDIIERISKQVCKSKRNLPKIDELVLFSFADGKHTLTFDEISEYIKKFPVCHDHLLRAMRKNIENNKIIKIETPGEKRVYQGHSYRLA